MCQCKEKEALTKELERLTEFSQVSFLVEGCKCKGIRLTVYNHLNEREASYTFKDADYDTPEISLKKITNLLDCLY